MPKILMTCGMLNLKKNNENLIPSFIYILIASSVNPARTEKLVCYSKFTVPSIVADSGPSESQRVCER